MRSPLYQKIREFYDASSPVWESLYGEYWHHGFYGPAGTRKLQRRPAQVDFLEEFLLWGGVTQSEHFLDVGCDLGGKTLYVAEKFQAKGVGITLSSVQLNRATERAAEKALETPIEFKVADALNLPFRDEEFDLVLAIESAEQMPNKRQFLQECSRVLKPQGKFLMSTLCHRPLQSVAGTLTPTEQQKLEEIYRVSCIPYLMSLPDYQAIAAECGLEKIETADWSTAVAPFLEDRSLNTNPLTMLKFLTAGWQTMQNVFAFEMMQQGFQRGLLRYGLLQATKP